VRIPGARDTPSLGHRGTDEQQRRHDTHCSLEQLSHFSLPIAWAPTIVWGVPTACLMP
jgi:hypothetical protein